MKPRRLQRILYVLVALSLLTMAGCSERQATPKSISKNGVPREDPALKDLATKAGLSFPTNAVLVSSGDGGGRDPSYGYYVWAVFSPSPITMPIMQAPYVKGYLNKPLADSVEFVEGMMPKQKISQPQAALGSSWETNGFEFRATLVRSPKGDYLVIERFRQK